jgi:hypothetical protein
VNARGSIAFRRRILRFDIKPGCYGSFVEKIVSSRSSRGISVIKVVKIIRKTESEKGTKAEGWMYFV